MCIMRYLHFYKPKYLSKNSDVCSTNVVVNNKLAMMDNIPYSALIRIIRKKNQILESSSNNQENGGSFSVIIMLEENILHITNVINESARHKNAFTKEYSRYMLAKANVYEAIKHAMFIFKENILHIVRNSVESVRHIAKIFIIGISTINKL